MEEVYGEGLELAVVGDVVEFGGLEGWEVLLGGEGEAEGLVEGVVCYGGVDVVSDFLMTGIANSINFRPHLLQNILIYFSRINRYLWYTPSKLWHLKVELLLLLQTLATQLTKLHLHLLIFFPLLFDLLGEGGQLRLMLFELFFAVFVGLLGLVEFVLDFGAQIARILVLEFPVLDI